MFAIFLLWLILLWGGYWDNAVSQCLFGEVASFESKTVGYFSIAFFYLAAGLLVVDILSMYFSYMRAAGKMQLLFCCLHGF